MGNRIPQEILDQIKIVDFFDYKVYLQSIYAKLKKIKKPYSYQAFAKDLGFSATNVMRLVITGKRKLSIKSANTIVSSLGLNHDPRKYFLYLVKYANARTPASRKEIFEKLVALKHRSLDEKDDAIKLKYFSNWYIPAIREMLRMDNFSFDFDWVADNLREAIHPKEIEKSFDILKEMGVIAPDFSVSAKNSVHDVPVVLPADRTANYYSLIEYHQQMLKIAGHSLLSVPKEDREFNSLTICISKGTQKKIKSLIRQFCHDVLDLEQESQDRSSVEQINIQFFPLTKGSS